MRHPGRAARTTPARAAPDLAGGPARPAVAARPADRRLAHVATAAIIAAIVIMIAASLLRASWMSPRLAMPVHGPPWQLSVRVSGKLFAPALWLAAVIGAGGVVAGLAAVRRGVQLPVRTLAVAGLLTVAALAVLPPAGSTDTLDYAAYGRLLALGHSPYVLTPYHLRIVHNAFGQSVPRIWQHRVSVYGPLATLEQYAAARLGGMSAARVAFWLKLWNALAFVGVAAAADRLLRTDPGLRTRAHLLWTANPLLLWDLVAAGHLDVLPAAAGVLGLVIATAGRTTASPGRAAGPGRAARPSTAASPSRAASLGIVTSAGTVDSLGTADSPSADCPSAVRAAAAGALIGVAADFKITYLLFGLGLAWAYRRTPRAPLIAGISAVAVLLPGYAWFGPPAIRAVLGRSTATSADNFYQLFVRHFGSGVGSRGLVDLAVLMVIGLAALLLWRLPGGTERWPAIRPALALSAAWLFVWPYQLPWYDAMIFCLLIVFPASRLDWLVLGRLTAGTLANMPGNPWLPPIHAMAVLDRYLIHVAAPLVLLAALVILVLLCLSGRWATGQPPSRWRDVRRPISQPA
jgi:hypothetical protein